MPVPPDDTLCRFINTDKWNFNLNLPTQRAFKQAELSVWNLGELHENNVHPEELLIEGLVGCGQSHHTAGDYLRIAIEVAQEEDIPCQVQVEWRPEKVTEPWWQWRYAHVQVEATEGPVDFPLEFRRRLAANSRFKVPPVQPI